MISMDYRLVSALEMQSVGELWAYCFEKSDDPFFQWFFTNYSQPDNVLGGFAGGQLLTCTHIIPYDLCLRGRSVAAGYIVGLATAPEARGTGAAGGLLAAALAEMRRRGQLVSILMPSRAGFYYPFNWELCYHHYKFIIPVAELAGISSRAGHFRPAALADWDSLAYVYDRFVMGRHGYVLRTQANWHNLIAAHLAEKGFIYLLERAGQCEGYLLYKLSDNHLIVTEMAYTDLAAQQALFYFLHQHRSQADSVEWDGPLDDGACFILPNPKQEIKLYPFMSARIVDALELLRYIHYPVGVKAHLRLEVVDTLVDWNNSTFDLAVDKEQGIVEDAGQQRGDISLSIGALTQLVFGRLNASQLARMGKIQGSLDKLQMLDTLFPLGYNYINEYF